MPRYSSTGTFPVPLGRDATLHETLTLLML